MEEKLIEAFYLFLIIFAPATLVIYGIIFVLGFSSFKLNADKGLLSQGLIWLVLLIPIVYFFVFGVVAWQDYQIEISSQGLSTFFDISKTPLTFLSLALPLTVLVARFHATEQTAKQIAIVSHKNKLDAFYSHRKEMFSYFAQLEPVDYFGALKGEFKVHPRLHKNCFIGSPQSGVPEINNEIFKHLEDTLSSVRHNIDTILTNKKPEMNFDLYLLNACVSIHYLSHCLGLPEIYNDLALKSITLEVDVKGEGKNKYQTIGTTTDEFVAAYRYANDYFKNLCDFSGYTITPTDKQYVYIDTGGKFRSMTTPNVIEQLHENEIADLLRAQA